MNIPEIFVLWHPDCLLGEVLARRIHAWLRPGNGLGPQVYYRSLPALHRKVSRQRSEEKYAEPCQTGFL